MSLEIKVVDIETSYEYRQKLEVHRNGELVEEYSDGGEPEDNSFIRDWSWVPDMIEQAYKWGLEDGKKGE